VGIAAGDLTEIKQLRKKNYASFRIFLSSRSMNAASQRIQIQGNWPRGVAVRPFKDPSSLPKRQRNSHQQRPTTHPNTRWSGYQHSRPTDSWTDRDVEYDRRDHWHGSQRSHNGDDMHPSGWRQYDDHEDRWQNRRSNHTLF
jgi:hypothetical protein